MFYVNIINDPWNLIINLDLHFSSGITEEGDTDQSYHFVVYSHLRNSTVSMLLFFLQEIQR